MSKRLASKRLRSALRLAPLSIKLFALHFSLFVLSGCGLFWDDPYVTVTATPLNWCEIHYYNATREPVRRVSVRVTGAGFVSVTLYSLPSGAPETV